MSPSAAWRPIGHVLVESGAISQDELELALAEQRRSGRRLGEILIDSGRITWLTLANAIAEQASDLEPASAEPEPVAEAEVEPAPEPLAPVPAVAAAEAVAPERASVPAAPVEPPLSTSSGPPLTDGPPVPAADPSGRLETVEAMLKERQRAFLELVSVTERLRANVSRLQEQLDERDAEILKLRARVNGSASAA